MHLVFPAFVHWLHECYPGREIRYQVDGPIGRCFVMTGRTDEWCISLYLNDSHVFADPIGLRVMPFTTPHITQLPAFEQPPLPELYVPYTDPDLFETVKSYIDARIDPSRLTCP